MNRLGVERLYPFGTDKLKLPPREEWVGAEREMSGRTYPHSYLTQVISTLPLDNVCGPNKNYHNIIFFLRYSKVALGNPLVNISPNCSVVSIFNNLIPRLLISINNQTVVRCTSDLTRFWWLSSVLSLCHIAMTTSEASGSSRCDKETQYWWQPPNLVRSQVHLTTVWLCM